jgi:hypothetical protein
MLSVPFYSQVLAACCQTRKPLDPSVGSRFDTSVCQTINGPVYLRIFLFSLINHNVANAPVSCISNLGTINRVLRGRSYIGTESRPSKDSNTGAIWEYVWGNSQTKEEFQSWQVTTVLGNCWIRKLLWLTGRRVKRLTNSPSFHCIHWRHKKER